MAPTVTHKRALIAASLLVVALLGVVHLPHPFRGDQALFLYGAERLSEGKVLYLDFWDNKQPGLYTFFLAGGTLFGFTEGGIHLLELLTLLLLAGIAAWSFRDWVETPGLTALIPIATVGAYYCAADAWSMTQLEILIGLPLFVCLILVARPSASPWGWFFSGIAASVAIWFKLILAPIPVAIWLTALFFDARDAGFQSRRLLRERLAPLLAGLSFAQGAVVLVAIIQGNLAALLWASFGYPLEVVGKIEPVAVHRLLKSGQWWVRHFGPWILLSIVAVLPLRKSLKDRRTVVLLVWVMAALVMIVVQVYSWWPYHFLLLVIPVGLLGVRGLDRLLGRARARSPRVRAHALATAGLAALAVSLPGLIDWSLKAGEFLTAARNVEWADAGAYRRAISTSYREITRDAAFLLAPDAKPGTVYIIGSPLYLTLTGRRSAIPMNGWSLGKLTRNQHEQLASDLAVAAPAYVYVLRPDAARLDRCCPAIPQWLETSYHVLKSNSQGTWYARRD